MISWQDMGRVLSLVSFDVQGAYNGVDIGVLTKRLRKRGALDALVKWIVSSCKNRRASVVVNGQATSV